MQEQVVDTLCVYLLPVAASPVLLGLLSREIAVTVLLWSEGSSLLNKKGQSVMRSTLEQEFQSVFVAKEVVNH